MSPKPQANTRPSSNKYLPAALAVAALAIFVSSILALQSPIRASLSRYIPSLTRTMATTSTTTTTTTTSSAAKPFTVVKRPWNARGHADHDWLYTFHTFSFASYYDPSFESFGPLRVINEDRVRRGTGFGTHSHSEFLIWSYIVSGHLEHKDSMGNLENLSRGEVQFTSAGTGIRHSEYNRDLSEDVHFLQIWAKPHTKGLKPSYVTRKFTDAQKTDRLVRIVESRARVEGDGEDGPIPLHADLSMSASILSPGKKVVHEVIEDGERNVYLHVVMGGRTQPDEGGAKIKVGNETLGEGDGAFLKTAKGTKSIEVESVGDRMAEFLLFDMGQ